MLSLDSTLTILCIKPAIKSKTDRITIKHTYSTDIPAEMAGDTVPILVPTTEFKDPVQFWISAPADDSVSEPELQAAQHNIIPASKIQIFLFILILHFHLVQG